MGAATESLPFVVDESVEKAAKLSGQWDKPHVCKTGTVSITREQWAAWPFYCTGSDKFAAWEMRHCPVCGSTLSVLTEIRDLGEE